ncbi:MAG: sigma-54 dependent transcriptional regulator [Pseudomonadales bacterium]
MAKILVADDEHAICEAFSRLLEREGHTPVLASSGREALEAFHRERPDAVFLDVQMPDMTGLQALEQIHRRQPEIPVIVMTAHGSVQTAMDALEHGAFDYLGKPLELPDIRALLARALYRSQPTAQDPQADASTVMQRDVGGGTGHDATRIIGRSRRMQEIYKMMGLLADNDLTVLITGESGTGKDLIARGIHQAGSRRSEPFVAINCAAIPEQLLESELFGHEKGAFTGAHARRVGRFESAGGGTLFLDEVAELSPHLQAKLLRVLQDGRFERVGGSAPLTLRARIIAASNRIADSAGEANPYREDFYYRLSLINLKVPPLRERAEDIADLAQHFLDEANQELGRALRGIEPDAMRALERHPWPGNVRQLQNTIRRSALTARGSLLTRHDLSFDDFQAETPTGAAALARLDAAARAALAELIRDESADQPPFRTVVDAVEQALVDEGLRHCDGNQVAASALLGINRTTLRTKHRR